MIGPFLTVTEIRVVRREVVVNQPQREAAERRQSARGVDADNADPIPAPVVEIVTTVTEHPGCRINLAELLIFEPYSIDSHEDLRVTIVRVSGLMPFLVAGTADELEARIAAAVRGPTS